MVNTKLITHFAKYLKYIIFFINHRESRKFKNLMANHVSNRSNFIMGLFDSKGV